MPCPACGHDRIAHVAHDLATCARCHHPSSTSEWGFAPAAPAAPGRAAYGPGMHGARRAAQREHGTSGRTHQSEHPVGYEVYGQGVPRMGSALGRRLEGYGPAYQEELAAHRGHIGTGMHGNYRGTGESSGDYREWQRSLAGAGQVGNAVQLNQLYYAHQPEFRRPGAVGQAGLAIADLSYQQMVDGFPALPFRLGGRWVDIPVTAAEQAEMALARFAARSGTYPSREQELEAMRRYDLLSSSPEAPRSGPSSRALDPNGIPKDGNCLFHSLRRELARALPARLGAVTADDLRRQAVRFLRNDPHINAIGAVDLAYLRAMEGDGTWAGELEAMAIAHVWGVELTVSAPGYMIVYNRGAATRIAIDYDGVGHYTARA